MEFNQISKGLIIIGGVLILAGLVFWFINFFIDLKDLPGTLQINIGGVKLIFPILVSVILSLVLTLILNIIARLLNK